MTVCLINFPRSYLFELSETVIDTQESSELFDDDGDPQNLLKKMGEITKIQAKYSSFSANGVQTSNLGLKSASARPRKRVIERGREISPRKLFKQFKTQTRKPFSFQCDLDTFHMFSPLT